jgi:hypothetical protein
MRPFLTFTALIEAGAGIGLGGRYLCAIAGQGNKNTTPIGNGGFLRHRSEWRGGQERLRYSARAFAPVRRGNVAGKKRTPAR